MTANCIQVYQLPYVITDKWSRAYYHSYCTQVLHPLDSIWDFLLVLEPLRAYKHVEMKPC